MDQNTRSFLIILGFEEDIKGKNKCSYEKILQNVLLLHPDNPVGDTKKFQKLEEAMRNVGKLMKKKMESYFYGNDDEEELLASDIYNYIFSQFNTTNNKLENAQKYLIMN